MQKALESSFPWVLVSIGPHFDLGSSKRALMHYRNSQLGKKRVSAGGVGQTRLWLLGKNRSVPESRFFRHLQAWIDAVNS
jgi:hypothetical protein